MSFYELQIRLPEQAAQRTTSPDAARHWIASLMAKADSKDRPDQRILHGTTPETSRGIAPIRFGWGRNFIRIIAVGQQSCAILASDGHKITALLARELNTLLPESRNAGHCRIEASRFMRRYTIKNLVLRDYKWADIKQSAIDGSWRDRPDVVNAVASTIKTGLNKQCALLNESNGDNPVGLPADFTLQVDAIDNLLSFRVKPDADMFRAVATQVRFSANVDLQGVWHVGRLISRGKGLVQPA